MKRLTTWTGADTVRAYVTDPEHSGHLSANERYYRRHATSVLEQFLGRPALLSDLSDTTFELFHKWVLTTGRKRRTCFDITRRLFTIARHAAEREIIPWPSPAWESKMALVPQSADTTRLDVLHYFEEVYLPDRETPLTAESLKTYRSAIRAFERFHAPRYASIACLRPSLIRRFRQWLLDRGMSRKKAGNHAFVVAAIGKHAHPTRFDKPKEAAAPPSKLSRNLADILQTQFLAERQAITAFETPRKYMIAIDSFGKFLGKIPTLDDLTDARVGAWMRELRNRGLAVATVNGYRSKLLSLWNWCAKKRFVRQFPTIEQIPAPRELPKAWTEPELRKLIRACEDMPGEVGGVPAGKWWKALHLVAWDSGERTGALLALKWDMLDWGTGQLAVPAEFRKGRRKPMLYRLKPETLRALGAIERPARDLIFYIDTRHMLYRRYKQLLKRAGLPYVRWKSCLQKMRRSFATHIEAQGGSATDALAHSERSLTVNHYIDPRLIDRAPPNERLFPLDNEVA